MPTWEWADTGQVQATASVISTILTLAYVLVTLTGFLLLRHQIKQVDLSARGETHGYLYSQQHSITRFFIDNPHLRPLFYDDKEVSVGDPTVIRAVTEMVADFCEHIYIQLPNLPEDVREGWERYLQFLYMSSPSLRLHLEENGSWYSDDFIGKLSVA
jgi:hypothetical protein